MNWWYNGQRSPKGHKLDHTASPFRTGILQTRLFSYKITSMISVIRLLQKNAKKL